MDDHTMADNLDRCLDALAHGDQAACLDEQAPARVARRYLVLGRSPAPDGARERVRRRVARDSALPRHNGRPHTHNVPAMPLTARNGRPADVPSPGHGVPLPTPRPPARSLIPAAALALIIVALLGAGTLLSTQTAPRSEPLTQLPAVIAPTIPPAPTTPPAPTASPDQLLLTIDLPAGALPGPSFGATFDHRTMPRRSQATEETLNGPLLRYVISGNVTVRATGPLWRSRGPGADAWEEIPANQPLQLGPGDAFFGREPVSLTLINDSAARVELVAWAMTPDGGSNSAAPDGWGVLGNTALHMATHEQADHPTQIRLRRIELAPGADLVPPPATVLDQFVILDVNATGAKVAPMLGKLNDGGRRNAGRQALTIYEVVVEALPE